MQTAEELFNLARQHVAAGRPDRAEPLFRQVLALEPRNVSALYQMGLITYHGGRMAEALDWFQRAVTVRPADPILHTSAGAVCQALGRLEDAARWHRQALQLNPNDLQALNNLGITLMSLGRAAEAEGVFRRALQVQPADAGTLCNLGAVVRALGRPEEAAACYREALRLQPGIPQAHVNLGNVLRDLDRPDEAEDCYRKAIEAAPRFAPAYRNWGQLVRQRGRSEESLHLLRQALQLQPADAATHLDLADTLLARGEHDETFAACQDAMRLSPDSAEVHNTLGNIHTARNDLDAAVGCYEQAIRLRPSFTPPRYNLGLALQSQGRVAEARACFEEVLRLSPGDRAAHSSFLALLLYDSRLGATEIHAAHRRWAETQARVAALPPPPTGDPQRRLRVGYVSPDFRNHPVAHFLAPILKHHDRTAVEVFCYAEVAAPDRVTAELRALADQWRSTVGLSTAQMVELIRQDCIDILVDLAGHTTNHRLLVFAHKPAPVQVSYLGYPCASGLPEIGCRLVDAITDLPDDAALALGQTGMSAPPEKLVPLPGCFCCYAPPQGVPLETKPPSSRTGMVTFGSLHKREKLNDDVLDLWARILHAMPASRVLLCRHTLRGHAAELLLRRLTERGVSSDRIVIRPIDAVRRQHLLVYDEVDVSLDVFPWNGHTTACEALWMGVPVVALRGRHHTGRMTASVLSAVGLPELIAGTAEDYCRIVVELAADEGKRADLRAGLRERMLASPLCDGPGFTRGLEAAYRAMWQSCASGL